MFNPGSDTPLYIQIRDHLRDQIESGRYSIGARLPSERELAESCGVSRMTARMALQVLSHDGLIYTRVGKGTFVGRARLNQQLKSLTSFTEDAQARGLQPGSRVLSAETRKADSETAEHLRIAPGQTVYVLTRVRLADDHPLGLEIAHLDTRLVPDLLARYDFAVASLYAVLREDYGLTLTHADQQIEARLPTAFERHALNLSRYDPVLSLRRTTFSADSQPIEYVRSAYVGTAYQLHATLSALG